MEHKYNIGDAVKVVKDTEAEFHNQESEWVGVEGKVIRINIEGKGKDVLTYTILTDGTPPADPVENEAWFDEDELELVTA